MSAERHRFGDLLSAIARLTPAQHSLLTAVSRHNVPVTVTQLAKESGLHASSVRETLEALYNSGLVTREQLPISGRGRPALGYLTLAPANAAFAGQLLEQSVSATLAWLRDNAPDPAEAAYDIGARWGEQAVSAGESAELLDGPAGGPKASGRPGSALTRHADCIRRFLTNMGFAAASHPTSPSCLILNACPYTDPAFPDPLALELRRGAVERIVQAACGADVDVEFAADPDNPVVAKLKLCERDGPQTAGSRRLTVRFYGGAAEAVQTDSMTFPRSSAPATLRALIDELAAEFPDFARVADISSFLVDERESGADTPLRDGAVVEVLPPFAGG